MISLLAVVFSLASTFGPARADEPTRSNIQDANDYVARVTRATSEGARWTVVEELTKALGLEDENRPRDKDRESIEDLRRGLEASDALAAYFKAAARQNESYMLVRSESLAGKCAGRIATANGATLGEAQRLFPRLPDGSQAQFDVLVFWNNKAKAAATLDEARAYVAFFDYAMTSTERIKTQFEHIYTTAFGGRDEALTLIFGKFELDLLEARALYPKLKSPQTRFDVHACLRSQENNIVVRWRSAGRLTDVRDFYEFTEDLERQRLSELPADKRAANSAVADSARAALMAVYKDLLWRPAPVASEMNRYFGAVTNPNLKYEVINEWDKRVRGTDYSRADLLELRAFFSFAVRDTQQYANDPNNNWVSQSALNTADQVLRRLLALSDATTEEANAWFREVRGETVSAGVLKEMIARALRCKAGVGDATPRLRRSLVFFDAAQSHLRARFGAEPKASWIEWVINLAHSGGQIARARLLRDPAINSDAMVEYYAGLDQEQPRANAVLFWRARLRQGVTSKQDLLALARFFYRAGADSARRGFASWVVQAATTAEKEAAAQIVRLYPVFEGTYEVGFTCPHPDDAAICAQLQAIKRLVLLNTLSNEGWHGSFINNLSSSVWILGNLELTRGASAFDAPTSGFGMNSELHLDFDVATGRLSGSWSSPVFQGPVEIAGRILHSYSSSTEAQIQRVALSPQSVPSLDEVGAREFRGVMAGREVILRVDAPYADEPSRLNAELCWVGVRGLKIGFATGAYDTETGILRLVEYRESGTRAKLTLGLQKVDGKVVAEGAMNNSMNGDELRIELHSALP